MTLRWPQWLTEAFTDKEMEMQMQKQSKYKQDAEYKIIEDLKIYWNQRIYIYCIDNIVA